MLPSAIAELLRSHHKNKDQARNTFEVLFAAQKKSYVASVWPMRRKPPHEEAETVSRPHAALPSGGFMESSPGQTDLSIVNHQKGPPYSVCGAEKHDVGPHKQACHGMCASGMWEHLEKMTCETCRAQPEYLYIRKNIMSQKQPG
jgi:hypothetical protein